MVRLPPLPYGHNALEPTLSSETLETHHDKHHGKYVEVVNQLIEDDELATAPLEVIIRTARGRNLQKLANNAGQAWNHAFFWRCMTPHSGAPVDAFANAIDHCFGTLRDLREVFIAQGAEHFGSGWVWLTAQGERLRVKTSHDGESLAETGDTPLLVCDLWEHAYYLDHKNDRRGFLSAWWDTLIDWDFAAAQFTAALEGRPGWEYRDALPAEEHRDHEHALAAALASADWYLTHGAEPGTQDEARGRRVAEELASYAARADEPHFSSGSDDLHRRIENMARRMSREPPATHWPVFPAF